MRRAFYTLVVSAAIIWVGCRDENSQETRTTTTTTVSRQTVDDLVARHGGLEKWNRIFSGKWSAISSEPPLSIEIEAALESHAGRPFLFLVNLQDIRRDGADFVCRFWDLSRFGRGYHIHLELLCDSVEADYLVGKHEAAMPILDGFAVVALLSDFARPEFAFHSNSDEVVLEPGNVLVLRGELVEAVFVKQVLNLVKKKS